MINAESIINELESFVYKNVVAIHGEKIATKSKEALFNCLWLNFRKQCIYVPTPFYSDTARRYQAIFSDFNGKNHAELGIKYRISLQQVYAIIRKMRAKHSTKTTPSEQPKPGIQDKTLVLFVIEEYLPPDLVKCGLCFEDALNLAKKLADFLCQNFPGVTIRVTDELKDARR